MAFACGCASVCLTAQGNGITRTVYVSVSDAKGQAVQDLVPADLALKEGGKDRPVVKVESVTGPVEVTLLIEDGLTGDTNVRQGIFQIVQRLHDRAEI